MIDVLALHRDLVATPSVSGNEEAIASFVTEKLHSSGHVTERIGNSLIASFGKGPRLILNSHLDTVPAQEGWAHDPWTPRAVAGRIYGLGSNDAKASVAALISAFLDSAEKQLPIELVLILAEGEETLGIGTQNCLDHLIQTGRVPDAAVIGEPTNLACGTALFGLAILNLISHGQACHAAHAQALGATNPIWQLASDIHKVEALDLGETTIQPTMLVGASAKNQIPESAMVTLDVRLEPNRTVDDVVSILRNIVQSEIVVHSDRLKAYACPEGSLILNCVQGEHFVSRTMSDQVFFQGIPAVKIGPGRTERSHTTDEFVLEQEILDGVATFNQIISRFAEMAK